MIVIEYDRKAKHYRWEDPQSGTVLTATSKQEKPALFKAAVAMLDPDLYASAERMIEDNPQLERVVWKGVEIVGGNGVEVFPTPKGQVVAMVNSQGDEYGRYAIQNDGNEVSCQCEHWQSMAAPITPEGRMVCKHIAAWMLHLYTRLTDF